MLVKYMYLQRRASAQRACPFQGEEDSVREEEQNGSITVKGVVEHPNKQISMSTLTLAASTDLLYSFFFITTSLISAYNCACASTSPGTPVKASVYLVGYKTLLHRRTQLI